MVTFNEIRIAVKTAQWDALRTLHTRAKVEGLEGCDDDKLTTVNLQVLECSMFKGSSPGHLRSLEAMLQAVERGNHPYDDEETKASLFSDAAIAQAQLDALVGKPRG